ncbi:MAG: hypothetical protein R3281_02215 [Balneolaceae bacterium]|nr:hypothetical protein [Balneolaceae bacterium]
MFLIQSEELLEHVDQIIHRDTQLHTFCIDLTVSEIHRYTAGGALDFGGSEYVPASTEPIQPQKRQADDDYGWWNLTEGAYRAYFNEKLQNVADTLSIISPHDHASKAGIIMSGDHITSDEPHGQVAVDIRVPSVGVQIKENARLATLHILAE